MLHQYRFQGQHENEQVLHIIHRHWFNILSHLFIIIAFSVILIGGTVLFAIFFPEALSGENKRFFVFAENTFFIFIWLFGFLVWIDYYFDIWIITNERIVNIEQRGLFMRQVSELRFLRVQDVTSEVEGLLPTILNFGDVIVQTAGEESRFVFRQVADPYRVKDIIMRLAKEHDTANMCQIPTMLRGEKTA